MDEKRKYVDLVCKICNKEYTQQYRIFKKAKWKHRCRLHRGLFKYKKPEQKIIKCPDCGKLIWRRSVKCKSCAYKTRKQKYCDVCSKPITYDATMCLKCHNIKQDKGLSTERNKFQNSKKWRDLRTKCFKRDNYSCQKCKKKKTKNYLNAHHIKSWKNERRLRLCLKNLITLCRKCHEYVHWGCV